MKRRAEEAMFSSPFMVFIFSSRATNFPRKWQMSDGAWRRRVEVLRDASRQLRTFKPK
jgi:hypothetical protein